MLRDHKFWVGFLVGYAVLVFFPQLNIRTVMARGR